MELGRENKVDICIDAEEADRLNLSLFMFKDIIESKLIDNVYHGFGFAIQAYQKRKTLCQDFGNQTGESNEEQRNTTATCI